MKNTGFSSVDVRIKNMCFCGVFAALTCVCTFISIPLPIGYFNLGDTMVLTGGWLLGPVWGTVAAALGSALADILMGFGIYAPATAIIKGAVALIGYALFSAFARITKKKPLFFILRIVSAIIGECFMVVGYLFFEAVILSYGVGAFVSIPGNSLQGICGAIGATLLTGALNSAGISGIFGKNKKQLNEK